MFTLEIRKAGEWTVLKHPYSSYSKAVRAGQNLAGYGQFTVTCPRVPTRDEQLLIKSKRQSIADELLS